ncbi:MAG TPA: YceI family protein [Pelobium sp.]|nr:YceI family protein [Pelobium sp.]
MKKYLLLIAFAGILYSFVKPSESYKVDLNRSKIEWTGRKVTGQHTGEIKLSSGQLNLNNGKLSSGVFEIDMNSMSSTDLSGANATKLLGHLKSDDFFSTDKNPTSKFTITKVDYLDENKASVTGNLIIKGISNPLTFPANVKQKNGVLVCVATGVKVDRTKYDIKYGSKSFIADLGDKAIANDFEVTITLVAKK